MKPCCSFGFVVDLAVRREEAAGVPVDLVADVGAQESVRRRRAVVEVDAAADAEAEGVLRAGQRLDVAGVDAQASRDAQAAVGARHIEEARAVGGADADVLDRRGLLHRKIRGLHPGHRGETRSRSEEKALNELH